MMKLTGFEAVAGCRQLWLDPEFLAPQAADYVLMSLLSQTQWPDGNYEVFGRRFNLPRLQSWHADPGLVYSYSDNLLVTRPWTPLLNQLRQQVEARVQAPFNAVLVNWYRDGNDYVGWHSDDERELGALPVIASLSLGVTRLFAFRRREQGADEGALALTHGSLLVMQPQFQLQWEHRVPETSSAPSPPGVKGAVGRINLTFRRVLAPA